MRTIIIFALMAALGACATKPQQTPAVDTCESLGGLKWQGSCVLPNGTKLPL